MNNNKYKTRNSILKRAQEIKGIPLRNIDTKGLLISGKGAIGALIEECWFGIRQNSNAAPDFNQAGIELKVTPYIRKNGKVRAKERLVCNIINYMDEYNKTFETSSFWEKCNSMLLMFYEHLFNKPKGDFKIDETILFNFPEDDLVIIKNDWLKIIKKIRNGKAHEISEGDTMYLAACTKGADSSSVRPQPFSDTPAKQRAYSLKSSYMTQVLQKYVFGNDTNERIIKNWSSLQNEPFEDIIINKLKPFYKQTLTALKERLKIKTTAKNINELILGRMLGIKGKISQTEEFMKSGIVPKTIRINLKGTINESMSFPAFDFIKLSEEEVWEESDLYNYLAPKKFMFVIFRQINESEYIFEKVKFWNISNQDLDEVKKVWHKTVTTIKEGVVLTETNKGISNNLPKQKENYVAHVRPHGRNASDTSMLPDGRMMTKQCFWLNRNFILKVIE